MTQRETLNNQESAGVDLTKVAALQQKRTIAFVNHFVITTVQFLNNFMKNCEEKLMLFERKMEKVEAAMLLLEARLSSIPEVNTEPETKPQEEPPEPNVPAQSTDQTDTSRSSAQPASQEIAQSEETQSTEAQPVNQTQPEPANREYDRFVKMVQVGVPLEAVKLKVSLEGLDPEMLSRIINK